MKKLLYILIAVALVGCEQYEHTLAYGGDIEFSAGIVSRGAVSQDNISSDTSNSLVQLYATLNEAAITDLNNEELKRDKTTGKWFTTTTKRWGTGNYSFHAYARNPRTGNGLTISNNGLEITVSQPNSYNESAMIDYLLSYVFKATRTDSTSPRPLVQIQLEHAMSAVDVYVVKGNNFDASLKSLTLRNIYRQGTMKCTSQAIANSGERNVWKIQPSGSNDAVYTFPPEDNANANEIGTSRENTNAKMSILCLPQQLTASTELEIRYQVNEKYSSSSPDRWVDHIETFQLYNYNPMNYQPGHRVIYTVTVDSGVNLEGTVTAWKDVDYIEGTVLPSIPSGDDNNENVEE